MKNKAFTLLEITVVVTIISLFFAIFVANYREGEKQFALKRSANKLAQDIRKAQEMAMAGKDFNNTFPKGGYGIFLEEGLNSYVLFADCDGDNQYDKTGSAVSCLDATKISPYPERIEEFFLEKGVAISVLNPATSETLFITFFPPDPTITINPPSNSASVSLAFDNRSKTIYINSVGLIETD